MLSLEQIISALRAEQKLLGDAALNGSDNSSESLLIFKGKWQGVGRSIEVIDGLRVEDQRKSKEQNQDPEFT